MLVGLLMHHLSLASKGHGVDFYVLGLQISGARYT